MPQLDFPSTPTAGQIYLAPNGVNYTWDDTVGVWTAAVRPALVLDSAGSVSGPPVVGATLTYSPGSASGGASPYVSSWDWKKESDGSVLQTDGLTYVVDGGLLGDRVIVSLTITDAASDVVSGDTAGYPTSPATIA